MPISKPGLVQTELAVVDTECGEAQFTGPNHLFGLQLKPSRSEWSITLIQQPSLAGVAALIGLLAAAIGISVGLQIFISRRRDRAERRPGRRLLRESMS